MMQSRMSYEVAAYAKRKELGVQQLPSDVVGDSSAPSRTQRQLGCEAAQDVDRGRAPGAGEDVDAPAPTAGRRPVRRRARRGEETARGGRIQQGGSAPAAASASSSPRRAPRPVVHTVGERH
ncbi:hypothetical protein PVAP13_8KG314802 [Panicum virgatum]|nr:hypothetical protein PVAP13_8KG314802 [Panicum virgatum]